MPQPSNDTCHFTRPWIGTWVALMVASCLGSCALPDGWQDTHHVIPASFTGATPSTEAPLSVEAPGSGSVSLRKCVSAGLEKNLSVKMASLRGHASESAVDIARAAFDPSVDFLGGHFSDGTPNEGNIVLRKRFETGTEVRAEAGTLFLDNSDRTEGETTNGTDYMISLRQPLLQGASRAANRAPMEKARLIAADASENTRIQVYEMLRGIETAYWTASFGTAFEASSQASVDRVRGAREIIAKKQAEGASTKLDSLEADAAVARAESALVNARKLRQDSLEQLWFVMGYAPRPPEDVQLAALTDAPVEGSAIDVDAHYAKAKALAPEVILLANDIRAQELNVTIARNKALPKVFAEVNWGSSEFISNANTSSLANTIDPSNSEWAALLRVSIPWNFRAERAQLDIARTELARSTVARENGMRLLQKDISESCRAVTAAHQQLAADTRGTEASRSKFTEQQLRYEAGLATARDVMEAETDLRLAETKELEDRLRIVIATVLLSRQDGSIMERHGLVF